MIGMNLIGKIPNGNLTIIGNHIKDLTLVLILAVVVKVDLIIKPKIRAIKNVVVEVLEIKRGSKEKEKITEKITP